MGGRHHHQGGTLCPTDENLPACVRGTLVHSWGRHRVGQLSNAQRAGAGGVRPSVGGWCVRVMTLPCRTDGVTQGGRLRKEANVEFRAVSNMRVGVGGARGVGVMVYAKRNIAMGEELLR